MRTIRDMMWRNLVYLLVAAALAAPTAGAQSSEEWRGVMHRVLKNLETADEALGDYAYLRHNLRRKFDSDGRMEEEHTVVARRDFLDGNGFTRQIERDGKPVPAEQLRQELATFRARQAEVEAMSPAQRAQLDRQRRQEADEARAFLKEFPEALNYRKIGEETIAGRKAIVLECTPRPGYKASNMRARVFEKTRGKVWIDEASNELVRVDAEVFEPVNIGWGLIGKIQKGTRFHLERRRLPNGNWLPQTQTVRFTVRVMLFKTLAQEETTRYTAFVHKDQPDARYAE